MRPILLLTLSALSALFVSTAEAKRFDDVEMKAQKVAGAVHMLTGAGGNIGVSSGPDGILIVDDQFSELAPKIIAALAKIEKGDLRFVLNTHFHGDHTGGNGPMHAHGATIVAHDNVRKRLKAGGGRRNTPPAEKAALPVITFDASLTIHFNGEAIDVLHLPKGHTDGDAVVFFTGSKVVHMGDHYFAGRFPFVDLSSGGDVNGYLANLATVIARIPDGAKVIPGHGPLSNKAELIAWRGRLAETFELVRKHKQAGKTLAAVKKAGLPKRFADLSWSFISTDTWIEQCFRSLGG